MTCSGTGDVHVQVVALALEGGVRQHGHDQVEVAVRAPPIPGPPSPAIRIREPSATPARDLHLETAQFSVRALDLKRPRRPAECLLQRHVDRLLVVLAAVRDGPPADPAASAAAEEVAEQVAEGRLVQVAGVESRATASAASNTYSSATGK